MSWIKRLFGGEPAQTPPKQSHKEEPDREQSAGIVPLLEADIDDDMFDIVGESFYQDALESIAGPKTSEGFDLDQCALLEPEPTNPYDNRAVAVIIDSKKVGHLAREHCEEFHKFLTAHGARAAFCTAFIVGGWKREGSEGSYGVQLDIAWPPQIEGQGTPRVDMRDSIPMDDPSNSISLPAKSAEMIMYPQVPEAAVRPSDAVDMITIANDTVQKAVEKLKAFQTISLTDAEEQFFRIVWADEVASQAVEHLEEMGLDYDMEESLSEMWEGANDLNNTAVEIAAEVINAKNGNFREVFSEAYRRVGRPVT